MNLLLWHVISLECVELSSLENSACLLKVVFVLEVCFPMRSHEFHCLLSLETVEHVLSHQWVLSSHVHLIAKSKLLFLVDLSLHVIVFHLVYQSVSRLLLVNMLVSKLVFRSIGILNREWIKVSSSVRVNIRVELISLTSSAAAVLHLNKVQRTTNWSMHVLELPISVLLLSLSNLSLPNLSVITLSIFLCLSSHL